MSGQQDVADLLADQLDRLLAKHVDREALAVIEGGTFPAALWKQVDDLGARSALVPESADGAGLAWRDAEVVMRVLGRHASPVPLGETMIGAALLAAAGLAVPEGPLAIVAAPLTLDAEDRLSGTDSPVAWAPVATWLIVAAERAGRRFVCLVDREDVGLAPVKTYGRTPSAAVRFDAVRAVALAPAGRYVDPLCALATLRSVQIAGSLEAVLPLCVEYANVRQQFGKPIGKFQAIQQLLAELAMQTAAAQVAGMYGCRRIDSGAGWEGVAIAKIRAGAAATSGAAAAHQIFGAIGVTDEHQLHQHTRRLWQWRSEAGSELLWAEKLGASTLAARGASLWPSLVDRPRW